MPSIGNGRTKKAKHGRKTGHQLSGASIPADVMAYRRNRIAQLAAQNTPKGQPVTDTDNAEPRTYEINTDGNWTDITEHVQQPVETDTEGEAE